MDKSSTNAIEKAVKNIQLCHVELEELIPKYRKKIEELEAKLQPNEEKLSGRYWRLVAYVDSLTKLRLFVEQNFKFIETMVVLSVTRYVLELSVWMKLLINDETYGLVYQYQLMEKQLHYYTDLENHLAKETEFFKEIHKKESDLIDKKVLEAQNIQDKEESALALANVAHSVQRIIDDDAAKRLCIYIDDALTKGYGYQAHLISQIAIPKAREGKTIIRKEIDSLRRMLPKDIKELVKEGWNWKRKAKDAGMIDEYEFIYSYTSRLMHATPVSLTTDQKNLEYKEIVMFLRYIFIRMKECISDAEKLLGNNENLH